MRSDLTRLGCSFIHGPPSLPNDLLYGAQEMDCLYTYGLCVGAPTRLAPMKFADSHLISRKSSKLFVIYRFSKSRSDLISHHTQSPTQPLQHVPRDADGYCVLLGARRSCGFHAYEILLVVPIMGKDRPDYTSHIVSQGYEYNVRWSSFSDALDPLPGILRVVQHTASAVNLQRAQIRIPSLADPQQEHPAAGTRLSGYQTEPGCKLAPRSE